MTNSQVVYGLAMLTLTTLIGIIAYFLKRTVAQVDKHDADINDLKDKSATKEELGCVQSDLRADVGKLTDAIDDLKDNSVRKDDFVRSIADINRRQDRIIDILMEMKGEKANG